MSLAHSHKWLNVHQNHLQFQGSSSTLHPYKLVCVYDWLRRVQGKEVEVIAKYGAENAHDQCDGVMCCRVSSVLWQLCVFC